MYKPPMDNLTLRCDLSVRDAFNQIEVNHLGVVCIVNDAGAVIAMATDGDLRRHLLAGGSLDDLVVKCANVNFTWCSKETSREELIKMLDGEIKTIPILDNDKSLLDLVTKESLTLVEESALYSRARSPVRISFGGGGSDLTHYFSESGEGAVINAAITLYSHATLRIRDDQQVLVHSSDLNLSYQAPDLDEALKKSPPELKLFCALFELLKPNFGFELEVESDFPMSSGLGGSAAFCAAVIGCFNNFRNDKLDKYQISEIAYQAERHNLGVEGGWQDQYATVFGGFNFMEFKPVTNIVHPLRIDDEILMELEESAVLCHTGLARDSGSIHLDQKLQMASADVKTLVKQNVELSYRMRDQLLRGRLDEFAKSLNLAWRQKRQFSSKISSSYLDEIYDAAIKSGALGGKLLGAGGGGYFVFFTKPFEKWRVTECLKEKGLSVKKFRFEQDGLKSWTCREPKTALDW